MMGAPASVFGHTIQSRRRGLLFWAIGIGAYASLILAFWPAMPEIADMERLMEQMPEMLLAVFGTGVGDLFSPAGFLDSQLFAMASPLLLLIAAIGGAAGTIAGEEREGTLELLLANPISRRRVVWEKAAGVAVGTALLTAAHFIVVATLGFAVGLRLGPGNLFAMHVSLLLLVWVYGAFALALSAATGRRGTAIGVAAAAALAGYLLESFAPIVEWLEPFRFLSPFYLYRGNEPLVHGLDPVHAGAMAALALLLALAAGGAFARRDIGT